MPLSPGDQLCPYEIVAPLGAAGMGGVPGTLLQTEPRSRHQRAARGDAQSMALFEYETQMLAALNHPGIAAIYGIEQGANPSLAADAGDALGQPLDGP